MVAAQDDRGDVMPRLGVVITSAREGRVGAPVAEWFMERARQHGGFEVELVDLEAVNLPMLSEPNHPRLKKHTQETIKAWSATVEGFDAFVFVTPEYNFSSPPALVNALDHLYPEWSYKAVGCVSYGGVSGGLPGSTDDQADAHVVQDRTARRAAPVDQRARDASVAGERVG